MAKTYRDFNFNFEPHPLTGDVSVVQGKSAIEQAIVNLILTDRYERPFQPRLHGSVHDLLFEPATPLVAEALKSRIEQVLEDNEPRAENVDVQVTSLPEQQAFSVRIEYQIRASTQAQTTTILLERNA